MANWRSVELREIRIFLVLAEELHFGHTAESVGLTQSRVSQSIRDLERKLGTSLAHRTSRRVTLTAAGESFRDQAGEVLSRLEGLLQTTEESSRLVQGPLRIGVVSPGAVLPKLQTLVQAYRAAHPRSQVRFVGLPFADRFGPLLRGEVELIMTALPLDQPGLVTGPVLSRERRMLAVAVTHPLAARRDVSVEELANYAIGELDIVIPRELADEIAPRKTPEGRTIPRIPIQAREASDLVIAVAEGRIVQPVTDQFARSYIHPGIVYLPIRDLPPSRSVLAWRRRNPNPALRAFLRESRSTGFGADGSAVKPTHT